MSQESQQQIDAAPQTQEEAKNYWNELAAGDKPAAEGTTPQPETPAADAAQATEPAPDLGEQAAELQLPKEVLDKLSQFDTMLANQQQLLHQLKSTEGRVAAIQREAAQARSAAQSVEGAAPNQQAINAAMKTPEKWESLKNDFPEWGDAVEALVKANLGSARPAQQFDPSPLRQEFIGGLDSVKGAIMAEVTKALEEARVENKHEGWKETVNTSDFATWFKAQQPEVQGLSASTKARDAIRLLDLFNEAKSKPASVVAQDRQGRLAAAARTTKGPTAPPRTAGEMTAAELWNHEAAFRERARAAY